MSFSSKTKNELSRLRSDDKCCQKAELSALIRVSGTIILAGLNKTKLKIITENAAVARLIFVLFKKSLNVHTEVLVSKNKNLKKNHSYYIQIDDANYILKQLGIIVEENKLLRINESVPWTLLDKDCCKRAYIRGVFLGGGSISDPDKGYHMEFVLHSEAFAKEFQDLINSYQLNAKVIQRKNNYVVYLKEGDNIVDLLNIIGAHTTLLNFENVRIVKQMRNNVNRLVNCETANLTKTVDAAYKQIQNIETIDKYMGLESLPENLKAIALLRLENKGISLKELGQLLDPPVGKSGVNHRFKKIQAIAEDLERHRGINNG